MPHDPRLTEPLRAVIARYLSAIDGAAPGLVEGLFLTGSVALADYHHGTSDIDLVALTARMPDDADLAALRTVHAELGAPHLDGVYLDRAAFEAMPDDARIAVHAHEGIVHVDKPCFELNPVLWRTIERHALTVRAPAMAVRTRTVDEARLRAWCIDNLRGYWLPLATRLRSAIATREQDAPAEATSITWTALGPGRLHCTTTTGDIISKTAAGAYTAQRFPHFSELLARAVAARHGDNVRFTVRDVRHATELIDAVANGALKT
jgi:hypothetical protein